MIRSSDVKAQAKALGFDLCGVAPAAALPELRTLHEWLARGYAGEMLYLHKSAETRSDVRQFLPSARSVIVTGTLYNTDGPAAAREAGDGGAGTARGCGPRRALRAGQDYHVVLAERLEALVAWMRAQHEAPFDASIFVDKHHVQERVYAQHAGLGWIGKNSCVINPELGSLCSCGRRRHQPRPRRPTRQPPISAAAARCASMRVRPAPSSTRTCSTPRSASRISRSSSTAPMPDRAASALGDHLYGCDICQEVCPWNLAPPMTADPAWQPRQRDGASAADLWQRTDRELHDLVRAAP